MTAVKPIKFAFQFTPAQIKYDHITPAVQNSPNTNKKILVTIDAMKRNSIKSWDVSIGPSVAEKTKMFEEIHSHTKESAPPLDRFMPNPLSSGLPSNPPHPAPGLFSIPRTISSACSIPGNTQPSTIAPTDSPKVIVKEQPRTVAQLTKVGMICFLLCILLITESFRSSPIEEFHVEYALKFGRNCPLAVCCQLTLN